jgi:hypothetical protein
VDGVTTFLGPVFFQLRRSTQNEGIVDGVQFQHLQYFFECAEVGRQSIQLFSVMDDDGRE